ALTLGGVLIDHVGELGGGLNRHGGRVGAVLQDAQGHLTGLASKLGVVDAQGRDRATLDGAGFRADYGDLVLLGNLDQGGDTADHHVVGGNVDGIHITECVHGLLDL